MTIIINILIFLAIFGYAAYVLIKHFKQSKSGQCGSCSSKCHCDDQIKSTQSKIFK